MYDVRGQELAGPSAQTQQTVETPDTPEAAQGQSAEFLPSMSDLIAACRSASASNLSEILRLAVSVPYANRVLTKTGASFEIAGQEHAPAGLYQEPAFWPDILGLLVANRESLTEEDRVNLGQLAASMPDADKRAILERVFGVPIVEGGRNTFGSEELGVLAQEAGRLPPGHVEGEEHYLESVRPSRRMPWFFGEKVFSIRARSMRSQGQVNRLLKGRDIPQLSERTDEAAEADREVADLQAAQYKKEGITTPAQEYARGFRHELGHAIDHELSSSASAQLREGAGWRRVDVETFIRACEPKAQDIAEAVALLNERFGAPAEGAAVDSGERDGNESWWGRLAAMRGRHPTLVAALESARVGKQMARTPVRGGYAHASFLLGRLSILSAELYTRLSTWKNPFAMVSDKEWAAELYTVWFGPGFDRGSPPEHFGAAERAYLREVEGLDPEG